MNTTSRAILSGAAVTAAAIALAGCTINIDVPGNSDRSDKSASSEVNEAGFSQRDLMFAEMMIPHHEQAVEMSQLAASRTSNAEVLSLAKQIEAAQAPEITQMQSWIDSSGASAGSDGGMGMGLEGMDPMDHGMGMGGMLTDEQMTALENASGAEFEKLYLEGMIQHHEGAISMARMVTNSNNAEAKKLGDAIVKTQTAEIEKMQQMLATSS